MKDVIMKIKGTQTVGDGEPDVIEMITEGGMDINDRRILLVYNEGEDLGGGKTELSVDGEKMAMLKRGNSAAGRIVIQKGKRHLCHYIIPQGEMMVGVFGENIKNTVKEVLMEQGVENANIRVVDRGALDCVIRARVETAILRGKENA